MIELDVHIDGDDALVLWLKKGIDLDDAIGRGLGDWAKDMLDKRLYGTRNYAPPPASSKYVRTGTLGANWGLARHGKTGVEFQNMTGYAGYVVGGSEGEGQAGIHAGRWWLARKRIEEGLDDADKAISKAIVEALGI